jgi:hypothetical protein
LKKFTAEKKLIFFKSKISIYLILGLLKDRRSYGREKPSALKREHPELKNMKSGSETLQYSSVQHSMKCDSMEKQQYSSSCTD